MTKHFEVTEKIIGICKCGGKVIKKEWEGITSFLNGSKEYCTNCDNPRLK